MPARLVCTRTLPLRLLLLLRCQLVQHWQSNANDDARGAK